MILYMAAILRFGLINALKLKHELKHNTQSPEVHLAVCAIAKNEGPYFTEWIEWHRRQGAERLRSGCKECHARPL